MREHDDSRKKARSTVEKQAIELIDEGADVIELLGALNLSRYQRRGDSYEGSDRATAFEPMLRSLYLKELLGYSDTELHRRLTSNPEEAADLGFDDDIPARTTFGRTWKNRFSEELCGRVQRASESIIEYAHEQGNPLGLRSLETEDRSEVSDRTQTRDIREKSKEVTQEMRELLYGAVDLRRPQTGTQYDTSSFLGLQSLLCAEECAAEQGSEIYADHAPRGVQAPDGDTHLLYLKSLKRSQILDNFHRVAERQLKAARRQLEFNRPVEIAIDMTYVAYRGKRGKEVNCGENNEDIVVMGAPPTKSYRWCYKFATVSIVGNNVRFMIAVRPHIKGQGMDDLVRKLYWDAREHVNIKAVYADSEFYAAGVVQALEETGSKYLIRVPENVRVQRQIRRQDQDVWVEHEYGIYGPTIDGPSNDRVETTVVGVPKNISPDETVVFATNYEVDDEIPLDRRETKRRINRYSRRWGIETNYRSLSEFLPSTTSKEYAVRLFHFAFALLIFNMWRLVDFLVQVGLDELEYRTKPRIKAKRFLNLAEPMLRAYG
jgi:hypothetical protein